MAASAFANCGSCPGDKPAAEAKKPAKACSKNVDFFVCAKDKTVANAAGKCATCGAELAKMHCLSCKDGEASLCPCGADCKCTANAEDPAKCSCGKDVVKVSVKDIPGCGGCKRAKKKAAE